MDVIQQFISEDLIYALGWTVMHSLWQGFLIAVLMAIVLQIFRKKSAKLRYEVATFSLFLVFISAVCTFVWYFDSVGNSIDHQVISMVNPEMQSTIAADTGLLQHVTRSCIDYFNQHLPLIVLLWLVGVAFFILRLFGGLAYVQRLKHHRVSPLPLYWQQKVQRIAAMIPSGKVVRILESATVKVPMVIGYFKPVILMPIGAVNQLDEQEVEAVIAHELAHVFRNDFLLNIILSFIEVFFYYHPAVWWISGNIRLERENCCDDIAIRVCGNSLAYAKALVRLQELNVYTPGFAMLFSGQKNLLLNRIKRILNQPQNRSNILERLTATCFLLIAILFMSASANNLNIQEEAELEEVTELELEEIVELEEVLELEIELDTIPVKTKVLEGEVLKIKQEKGEIIEAELDGKVISIDELKDYDTFELDGRIMVEQIDRGVSDIWTVLPDWSDELAFEGDLVFPEGMAFNIDSFPQPTVFLNGSANVFNKKQKTIIRSTNDEGKMIIVIDEPGTEPVEIIVDDTDDIVMIDGNALAEGDTAIVIDQFSFPEPVFPNVGDQFNNFSIKADSIFISFPDGRQWHLEQFNENPFSALETLKQWPELSIYYQDRLPDYIENRKLYQDSLKKNLAKLREKRLRLKDSELRKEEIARFKETLRKNELHLEENKEQLKKELAEYRAKRYAINKEYREKQLRDRELLDEMVNEKFKKLKTQNNKTAETIIAELQRDGLIDDPDNFSFSLSVNKLKVNRKKQSKAMLEKYLKLYEKLTGSTMQGKSKYQISKNNN